MLVFLDLETTGIDERTECILEVGMIVTDDSLRPIEGTNVIVKPLAGYDMSKVDPFVVAMHTKNGLLEEIKGEKAIRRYEAEAVLVDALVGLGFSDKNRATIAGNSVHFDLICLREHMPKLHNLFSHRILDVTTINEVAKRIAPDTFKGRPSTGSNHRAWGDCEGSMATMQYYLKNGLFTKEG
jgi:oligoribonuclease